MKLDQVSSRKFGIPKLIPEINVLENSDIRNLEYEG